MAYDRMDWHYGGQFPQDLPNEAGGTHIGMYMAWAFSRGMASDELREDAADELALLAQRAITGRDVLIDCCDEKFWADDLTPEGQAFAKPITAANRPLPLPTAPTWTTTAPCSTPTPNAKVLNTPAPTTSPTPGPISTCWRLASMRALRSGKPGAPTRPTHRPPPSRSLPWPALKLPARWHRMASSPTSAATS